MAKQGSYKAYEAEEDKYKRVPVFSQWSHNNDSTKATHAYKAIPQSIISNMSHLEYTAYPGYGHYARDVEHHHQVVKVGDQLIMSGQVGLDRALSGLNGIVISTDLDTEFNQAFKNVDVAFKEAGGKGIEQVYKYVVYLNPYSEEGAAALGRAMKKWFPKHKPVVTAVGVSNLAYPGQRIEVDAYAHLG